MAFVRTRIYYSIFTICGRSNGKRRAWHCVMDRRCFSCAQQVKHCRQCDVIRVQRVYTHISHHQKHRIHAMRPLHSTACKRELCVSFGAATGIHLSIIHHIACIHFTVSRCSNGIRCLCSASTNSTESCSVFNHMHSPWVVSVERKLPWCKQLTQSSW